jgi:hypothetical protein
LIAKAYISNISPRWPVDRQVEMLRAAIPGWPRGVTIFRDELDVAERKAHRKNDLAERNAMLRGSSRSMGAVYMASLAVLDWSADGLVPAITLALSRGATLRVLDADLTIRPDASAADLAVAMAAFEASRKADRSIQRGSPGGKASAEKRAAEARARALSVFHLWQLPTREWPQPVIAQKASLSINTLKLYLPPRHEAQRDYQAEQKRLKTRAARAAKEST